MKRDTLLDFFDDFSIAPRTFLVHDDGLRSTRWTYGEVAAAAKAFAARLDAHGLSKNEKVVFWVENRPEWIVAFWGCMLGGIVVVPIDFRASPEFLARVREKVGARVVLVGRDVRLPADLLPSSVAIWNLEQIARPTPSFAAFATRSASRDDVAEIIFTSGATAEPKGVVITHRNILANIVPIEKEIAKYRRYGKPFSPIRFLNLLPLSHMFGQAMATFIPPMITGEVIFIRGYNPHEIVQQIRTRRISVLVCVPKLLDVLRDYVRRRVPAAAEPSAEPVHWTRRWWRYRDVHRLFGWKFWAAVVGAAPLDADLEEYWSRLGFLVVQGYGLTETAPIVTLNHPFSAQKGSVGKPIHGVEVRIAPDGEILVRGENVTTGYYGAEADASVFEDGWLHTGDIGGMDDEGRVFIRGRKKEMIVTPEGLNVFPDDVERALNAVPGVRESAVVGRVLEGDERVHAVLALDAGTDPDAVVRQANLSLADHQKIRSATVWPEEALPRTEGTRKLKRAEIRQRITADGIPAASKRAGDDASVRDIVASYTKSERAIDAQTTLDELGLSSLEHVELLMALEDRFATTIEEGRYAAATTVGDLEALVAPPLERPERAALPQALPQDREIADRPPAPSAARAVGDGLGKPFAFPFWNRSTPARWIRRISLPTWILPPARAFAWIRVRGLEHLETLEGPVVFAANHQSHLDTPAVMWALPPRWRYRLAVAMAKEFFTAHFFPERHRTRAWLTNSLNYYLASLFFNAFPIPQREAGTRQTLRYMGSLIGDGYSILIFPEGKRTQAGEISAFRPGIGMIGSRLDVPVVPVRLMGLEKVLHQSWLLARPGRVDIIFGPAMRLRGDDYAKLASDVEEAVRSLHP
jgi:long-chain acyl-CoA synthetase